MAVERYKKVHPGIGESIWMDTQLYTVWGMPYTLWGISQYIIFLEVDVICFKGHFYLKIFLGPTMCPFIWDQTEAKTGIYFTK